MERAKRRLVIGVAVTIIVWTALRLTVLNAPPHPATIVGRAMLLTRGLSPTEVARRLGPPAWEVEKDHGYRYAIREDGVRSVKVVFVDGRLWYATGTEDRRNPNGDMRLVR